METQSYIKGTYYQCLICRSFKCYPSMRNGSDQSVYHLIFQLSNGYKLPGKSPEKQLQKVKACLIKAFDKFLKRRLTKDEKEKMVLLREHVLLAVSLSQIDTIIEEGLEATQKFKEYIPS